MLKLVTVKKKKNLFRKQKYLYRKKKYQKINFFNNNSNNSNKKLIQKNYKKFGILMKKILKRLFNNYINIQTIGRNQNHVLREQRRLDKEKYDEIIDA